MEDVTQILARIESGETNAAEQLLPLVYDELQRLAGQWLAREKPGHTLQATALVHEAYMRLVDVKQPQSWDSRRHFFAAAARAMRRILIESARRKQSAKLGGDWNRVELHDHAGAKAVPPDRLLALDEALNKLTAEDPQAAQLIEQCLFAGLTAEEAGKAFGWSRATAYRHWAFARAYLSSSISSE